MSFLSETAACKDIPTPVTTYFLEIARVEMLIHPIERISTNALAVLPSVCVS